MHAMKSNMLLASISGVQFRALKVSSAASPQIRNRRFALAYKVMESILLSVEHEQGSKGNQA